MAAGYTSLLAFWLGGASAGEAAPVADFDDAYALLTQSPRRATLTSTERTAVLTSTVKPEAELED